MDDLHRLAHAVGVATEWTGNDGRPVGVADDTLRTVLAALGALRDGEAAPAALERHERTVRDRILAPTTVVRPGTTEVPLSLPAGTSPGDVEAVIVHEDGTELPVPVIDDGTAIRLPVEFPLGYHRIALRDRGPSDRGELAGAHLIGVPASAPPPERGWGWMVQLYALRSADSWGFGDLGDLRGLLTWSGQEGADLVVCNPLHAAAPTLPQEPSPYYPSSRRYWHPIYLRIETVPEYTGARDDVRRRIEELAGQRRADNTTDRIDRDTVWDAKRRALGLLWTEEHTPARREAFAAFRAREGEPLQQFCLWSALSERHGPDWHSWPEPLRHPSTAAIAPADDDRAAELADRVDFHAWLQFLTDEQLAAAQVGARHAGMPLGVVHDLAVGVNPAGADAWALQDHLATGVTVGAPPDAFNQQGQDWGQPPLLPQKLQETGYVVIRDLVGRLLRHAGGVRIDHILGYFRFFWVPDGDPQRGTYVTYPADDLLGVLALEADRAGAVVIGEDLGVVAPGVREALRDHGLLGSELLYFAFDRDGQRQPADAYEPLTLASITTHDLPTAAGWWQDEGVRVQSRLAILGADVSEQEELDRKQQARATMRRLLADHGLITEATDPSVDELVVAMHAFLGRSGSRLVAANVPDAVGDTRQPNLPGTVDEYPNWRLPIATPTGDGGVRPVSLEELRRHALVRRVIDALSATRDRRR